MLYSTPKSLQLLLFSLLHARALAVCIYGGFHGVRVEKRVSSVHLMCTLVFVCVFTDRCIFMHNSPTISHTRAYFTWAHLHTHTVATGKHSFTEKSTLNESFQNAHTRPIQPENENKDMYTQVSTVDTILYITHIHLSYWSVCMLPYGCMRICASVWMSVLYACVILFIPVVWWNRIK